MKLKGELNFVDDILIVYQPARARFNHSQYGLNVGIV
jgi:hypothetical protein